MSNLTVNAINGVDVQNIAKQTARAWVNFNGTGVVAIRKAYNVASITDLGVGVYGINFTAPMPDANYVGVLTIGPMNNSANYTPIFGGSGIITDVPPATTGFTMCVPPSGSNQGDAARVCAVIFD